MMHHKPKEQHPYEVIVGTIYNSDKATRNLSYTSLSPFVSVCLSLLFSRET